MNRSWFESVTPEEYPEPSPSQAHEFDYPESAEDVALWEVEKAKARAFAEKWLPVIRMRVRQAGGVK